MFFEYDYKGDAFDVISICFGTILHELKHYWQLKNYGCVLYGLLQLPIIRNYTIEKSAYQISDYVTSLKISERIICKECVYLKAKYNVSNNNLNKQ
jgi:hypothetical protein